MEPYPVLLNIPPNWYKARQRQNRYAFSMINDELAMFRPVAEMALISPIEDYCSYTATGNRRGK
jgi:hypothetical protein